MKLYLQISLILVIFFKTGNLLSENYLFNVNNILLEKKESSSSKLLADKAIKSGFDELINRILMKEDISKISSMSFVNIKELVTFYNISKNNEQDNNKVNFSVTFDKDKVHDLFYKRGISYSDIAEKEFYILPVELKENEIFIFSNNYFYDNWNIIDKNNLIEFILPLENIEIIQNINQFKNNLLNLNLETLFKEYSGKNVALVLIENSNRGETKIYLNSRIQEKIISKSLNFKKENLKDKIIYDIKDEIINLVKSQNLIDIRTPSFLNAKLNLNKKSNLVLLNSRINNIDLVENIFVQEFNKDYLKLKIKFLGKLEKIITLLKKENINLKIINDQWFIEII